MSPSARSPSRQWLWLVILQAVLVVLLWVQARRTREFWDQTRQDREAMGTENARLLQTHKVIVSLMSDLISLAATNGDAARIVREHGISITDTPPPVAPGASSTPIVP